MGGRGLHLSERNVMAKKEYKVVGDLIVHGFKKGETFAADLPEHEERLLIESGHVKPVKQKETTAPSGGTAATQ